MTDVRPIDPGNKSFLKLRGATSELRQRIPPRVRGQHQDAVLFGFASRACSRAFTNAWMDLSISLRAVTHEQTLILVTGSFCHTAPPHQLDYVTEQDQAFARMRFSGIHTGVFRGHQPTGKPVHWLGAALFRIERGAISELWVLGDLAGLDRLLQQNRTT